MRINYLPAHPEREENAQAWNNLIAGLGRENPCYFAENVLGLHLNPFQTRALIGIINNKQWMWVTANQVGKTLALAVAHIYWNFYKVGITGGPATVGKARYQTLNLSPISRQAQECARYVREILSSSFTWEEEQADKKIKRYVNKCKVEWFFIGEDQQQGRIEFDNNSFMFCLSTASDSGSGIQGMQFAAITYDECNQSMHLEEELPARIFSRTAKYNGPIGLVATPDEMGKSQQYWYHLYTQAENDLKNKVKPEWFMIKGVYDENIFITKDKREEYKVRLQKLSPEKYKQVILGQFLASADRMFTPEMIEGLWNGKNTSTPPIDGHKYSVHADLGVSDAGDETVIFVADYTDLENVEIVNHYSKRGGDPVELMSAITMFCLNYNGAELTIDMSEMGGIIFKKMLSKLNPISCSKEHKPDSLFYLQLRLRNNLRMGLTGEQRSATSKLKSYYIPKLEAQLSSYKIDDSHIKQDWVMALSQVAWFCDKRKATQKIEVFSLTHFYSNKK